LPWCAKCLANASYWPVGVSKCFSCISSSDVASFELLKVLWSVALAGSTASEEFNNSRFYVKFLNL
jgi:hypothetical protein